ncbi:MAG: hypothetical protein FJZ47_07515 [Candidatus Tectomicrobia bacterium]|uniref:Uncharacterized protein n=1 Tax=Tectimicrobiota bacterium TaxID=2528274 RepID=A0A938B0D4_UNCTE|nr:hypothetical protein [Candidatus Tectomicrobia bacterium]
MEFHTDREAALYSTLKQVLHNHVVHQQIPYQETLAACTSVLGYVLYVMLEDWTEVPGLVESTLDELQQRLHTRAQEGEPQLPSFQEYTADAELADSWQDLGTALADYLTTAGLEHDMSVAATWRAYLALLADLYAMPLHDGAYTLPEAEAAIMALRGRLPAVMQLWAEEQS